LTESKNNTSVLQTLSLIEKMGKWSADDIQTWQSENLKKLVIHVYNNTLYYRKLFKKIGLVPSDIKGLNDISNIPTITKSEILQNIDSFTPSNIKELKFYNTASGGSSGDPLKYRISLDSESFIVATDLFYKNKFNYRYGEKMIVLGAASLGVSNKRLSTKKRIAAYLKGFIPLDAMNLKQDQINSYLDYIEAQKVKFIYGYASAIFLLAKHSAETKRNINLIAVFPTSEVLTEYYRTTIKSAFNCDIMDGYGARDGGIVAYETIKNHYCVGYNSYIEVSQSENEEKFGEILCTDLLNLAFPFIRYKLGDSVELMNNSSTYNGQVIGKVVGRSSDIIRLANGNILTGPGFTVLFHNVNVDGYQLVQENECTLKCRLKINENYNEDNENRILEVLHMHAGKDTIVKLEYVKEFELLKSGKLKYFIPLSK
jgi:phenylacetate-CoA ligase